jgi:uncharacterized repeat protein (TIGR01451 family)
MKSKYIAMMLLSLAGALFLLAKGVSAQECVTQYGGTNYGTPCQPVDLTVNKLVQHPTTSGVFVENLTSNDPSYSAGSEILFKMTIKNSSGETFHPVTVRDVLPEHLTFVSGPGTYDTSSRTLTFTMDNLVAGESRTVEILTRVVNVATDAALLCESNFVKVTAPARPNGDEDTSQFCVQTQVLGVTTLPVAGYNDLLVILPFAAAGLGGIALLKKRG